MQTITSAETQKTRAVLEITDTFNKLYKTSPLVVRSPGRVNIIGEHTDYNQGFVLPAAIDKASYVAIGKRDDNEIHLYSCEFEENFKTSLSALSPTTVGWPNYVLGVVDQLLNLGFPVSGFNLVVAGDIPIGAGLSSSAALECATAYAMNQLFNFKLSRNLLAGIAQKAEHSYAGVMCGIMDQFASLFGKKNHVIKLDCRSMEFEYFPLDMTGIKIVLFNTNVKHSLSSSEYNVRRQQCEQGVEWVQEYEPEIRSLRDCTLEMLDKNVASKDELIYRRCKYVVEENIRLLKACDDLKKGDIKSLGQRMFETHDGLKRDYEVSCKELDFLVDQVKGNPDVLGARMMGGGFGGCTINLVKEEAIDRLVEKVSKVYREEMDKDLSVYIAKIEEGTSIEVIK